MNPNDNNPLSPVGSDGGMATGGSSQTPSSLDFTNPDTLGSTSSLSMSDSLASAQDNLMSAGQAADYGNSSATSLNQLGASDASATMSQPAQPLTPADPVPGSIGSVTSVPPVATGPTDMGSFNSSATTAAMPSMAGATSSSMPVMGQSSGNASAQGQQAYYNPFSRTSAMPSNTAAPVSNTPTSSTNVPPALQPQTEKFSDRLKAPKEKKSGGLAMILGWLMAALFAASTAVFVILWIQAINKKPEVIYTPSPEEVKKPISMVSCTQDLGAENPEGLEGLVSHRRDITASYSGNDLSLVSMNNIYTFTDNAMAEVARGYFDEQIALQNSVGENFGVDAIDTSFEIIDNVANYDLTATADKLVGDYIATFMVPLNVDDSIDTDAEAIQESYEKAGFVCSIDR